MENIRRDEVPKLRKSKSIPCRIISLFMASFESSFLSGRTQRERENILNDERFR